jgi:hypothetical protein
MRQLSQILRGMVRGEIPRRLQYTHETPRAFRGLA